MKNFLYVFTQDGRDVLLNAGYVLLSSNVKQNIYIFKNKDELHFSLEHINVIPSDTFIL